MADVTYDDSDPAGTDGRSILFNWELARAVWLVPACLERWGEYSCYGRFPILRIFDRTICSSEPALPGAAGESWL